jgi:hypothetical protein
VRHVTIPRLQVLPHLRRNRQSKGWTATRQTSNCTMVMHPSASPRLTWRPGPTSHVTGAPITTYKKLHRRLYQCCASSTAEPTPRLEATLRATLQCQFRETITGQSAAGIGAAFGVTQKWAGSNGGDRRVEAAVESPAGSRPLQKRQDLSHRVKTTRPFLERPSQRAPRKPPVSSH